MLGAAVVLVATLGWFVWKENTTVSDDSGSTVVVAKKTPSPTVTATATVDPTADWKTYQNSRYGFSIKYPRDWYVDASNAEKDFTPRGEEKELIGGDTAWSNYAKFDYTLATVPDDRQLVASMIYETDKGLDAFYKDNFAGPNKLIEKTVGTVGGKSSLYFHSVAVDHPVGVNTYSTLVKLQGGIMFINYSHYPEPTEQKDASSTYKQMVSTLKFTN